MSTFEPIGEAAARVVEKLRPKVSEFEQIPITSREQWLQLRQRDVTASAAGALLGVHEFLSGFALWALKTGRIDEDPEESPAMRRGRLLEPVGLALLREQYPHWQYFTKCSEVYYRDPVARLGATPDVQALDPERGHGIIQIKTVEPSVFRRKWRDEDGELAPPLWVAVQCILEAHLTGADWAAVAALVVSYGCDLHLIPVPIHDGVIDRVRAETEKFWKVVESGVTPPMDYARDASLIEQMLRHDDGTEIDLTTDNRVPALAAEKRQWSAAKTEAEGNLKAINAEILAKLGPATSARFAGGRIAAKTVHRKSYSVAASSYRAPRIIMEEAS